MEYQVLKESPRACAGLTEIRATYLVDAIPFLAWFCDAHRSQSYRGYGIVQADGSLLYVIRASVVLPPYRHSQAHSVPCIKCNEKFLVLLPDGDERITAQCPYSSCSQQPSIQFKLTDKVLKPEEVNAFT